MKSVVVAYVLWLFGGVFGWHHAYLNRTTTAVGYFFSLGGFTVLWFLDLFFIPTYVRQANWMCDIEYLHQLAVHQKYNKAPTVGFMSIIYQFSSGLILSHLFSCLAPKDSPDLLFSALEALGTALGVCYGTFGAVSRHSSASLVKILVAAVFVKIIVHFSNVPIDSIENASEVNTSSLACVSVCYLVYLWTRKWTVEAEDAIQELKNRKTRPQGNGFLRYCVLILAMTSIVGTGLVQHGEFDTIDTETGQRVKYTVREALDNILQSPAFTEFSSTMWELYEQVRSEGFSAGWEHVKVNLDPDGRLRAFKDLGLDENATPSEIKSTYRRLALKYHPDKVSALPKDQQDQAQEKFIRIQQAYEILAKQRRHDEL